VGCPAPHLHDEKPGDTLLDEPFSSLDAITRIKMQTWYQSIVGEMGLSILFITHDVEEMVTLSDRVYILNGKPGRITHCLDILRPRFHGFPTSSDIERS
jgi:ABC-type nitrate/sulfonate/bicarbonate transport system ATPase subunit